MSRLAVVHPTTLLGQEVRQALDHRSELGSDVRLLAQADDVVGTLTQVRGEAAVVAGGGPEELEGVDLAFLCGSLEASRPYLDALPAGTTAIVLSLDAGLDVGRPVVAGIGEQAVVERGEVIVSPHPSAVLLAHLLWPLERFGVVEATATVIEPVSAVGEEGLDELLGQTRQILAMVDERSIEVFGGQLAFNFLPGRPPGGAVIGEQTRRVLGLGAPIAVQTLQGAVFHGVAASLYVRLQGNGSVDEASVTEALSEGDVLERAEEPELLGPIEAATRDSVLVGPVSQDRGGGFWIWAVMDNLTRGGAMNAVALAARLLERES